MRKFLIFNMAAIVAFSSTTPAHAYLDPGTGSLIVQSIIGGAAAAMTVAGVYYTRIRSFFDRIRGKTTADPESTEASKPQNQ